MLAAICTMKTWRTVSHQHRRVDIVHPVKPDRRYRPGGLWLAPHFCGGPRAAPDLNRRRCAAAVCLDSPRYLWRGPRVWPGRGISRTCTRSGDYCAVARSRDPKGVLADTRDR
jgi:hypothetical protein